MNPKWKIHKSRGKCRWNQRTHAVSEPQFSPTQMNSGLPVPMRGSHHTHSWTTKPTWLLSSQSHQHCPSLQCDSISSRAVPLHGMYCMCSGKHLWVRYPGLDWPVETLAFQWLPRKVTECNKKCGEVRVLPSLEPGRKQEKGLSLRSATGHFDTYTPQLPRPDSLLRFLGVLWTACCQFSIFPYLFRGAHTFHCNITVWTSSQTQPCLPSSKLVRKMFSV